MINIFVGLSQNQIESFELLIKKGLVKSGTNIILTNYALKLDANLWTKKIISPITFNNNSNGILDSIKNIIIKIQEYKKLIKKLKEYSGNTSITIYFTYIEDILTNYLLLSFNKNVTGVVVEDGTLNYYNHTIKFLSKKKVGMKWLLANLLGVRFKLYSGHSSGINYDHVKYQFVRIPSLSMCKEKSRQLPFKSYDIEVNDSILVVGQEAYIHMFGMEKYLNSLSELMHIIKSNNPSKSSRKIFYKPHRHGMRIDYKILDAFFENDLVEILDGDDPLESLYFNRVKSHKIYGFDSSALVNINLEMAESTRANVEFNVLLSYNRDLEPLFKMFNFNIYK